MADAAIPGVVMMNSVRVAHRGLWGRNPRRAIRLWLTRDRKAGFGPKSNEKGLVCPSPLDGRFTRAKAASSVRGPGLQGGVFYSPGALASIARA